MEIDKEYKLNDQISGNYYKTVRVEVKEGKGIEIDQRKKEKGDPSDQRQLEEDEQKGQANRIKTLNRQVKFLQEVSRIQTFHNIKKQIVRSQDKSNQ